MDTFIEAVELANEITCRILSGSTTSATDHIRLPKKVF